MQKIVTVVFESIFGIALWRSLLWAFDGFLYDALLQFLHEHHIEESSLITSFLHQVIPLAPAIFIVWFVHRLVSRQNQPKRSLKSINPIIPQRDVWLYDAIWRIYGGKW